MNLESRENLHESSYVPMATDKTHGYGHEYE